MFLEEGPIPARGGRKVRHRVSERYEALHQLPSQENGASSH